MSTKKSSDKIRVLIINDFRKFWVLSLVIFAALFFGTCAPALLSYNDEFTFEHLMATVPSLSNGIDLIVSFAAPIVASLLVFKYLHTVNASVAFHSLPASRKQHYIAHTISGYLLCAIPVILAKIIFEFIALGNGAHIGYKLFISTILLLIVMLVIFSISNVGAMLTGTSLMHFIGATGLNLIVVLAALAVILYSNLFLVGFTTHGTHLYSIMRSSVPFEYFSDFALNRDTLIHAVSYVVISLIMIYVGYTLYSRRKLETATDPISYKKILPAVVIIMTFLLSSCTAALFSVIDMFYFGLIAGSLILFILVTMLVRKSTRIFTKKSLKIFTVYVIITALFTSFFAFDIFGYNSRIPDVTKAKAAYTDALSVISQNTGEGDRYSMEGYHKFTSPEAINALAEFTAELEKEPTTANSSLNFSTNYIIKFEDGNSSFARDFSKSLKRDYFDIIKNSPAIKKLYNTKEFKEKYKPSATTGLDLDNKEYYMAIYTYSITERDALSSKQAKELLKAMDKDFASRTFEQELKTMPLKDILGYIMLPAETAPLVAIRSTDTNVLRWLKDNNLYEKFDLKNYSIDRVEVTHFNDPDDTGRTINITDAAKKYPISDFLIDSDVDYDSSREIIDVSLTYINTVTNERTTIDSSLYWDEFPHKELLNKL